jgi:hypothetical protein
MTAMEILFKLNKNIKANYSLLDVKIFTLVAHHKTWHKNMLAITPHHHPLASIKPCHPWSLAKNCEHFKYSELCALN